MPQKSLKVGLYLARTVVLKSAHFLPFPFSWLTVRLLRPPQTLLMRLPHQMIRPSHKIWMDQNFCPINIYLSINFIYPPPFCCTLFWADHKMCCRFYPRPLFCPSGHLQENYHYYFKYKSTFK